MTKARGITANTHSSQFSVFDVNKDGRLDYHELRFSKITKGAVRELPNSTQVWYCRSTGRRLHFPDWVAPSDAWDIANFGAPVPEGDFLDDDEVKHTRSEWMYYDEKPSKSFPAGTVAKLPPKN